MQISKKVVLLLIGCGIGVFVASSVLDCKLDAQLQQEEYCGMVLLGKTSKGELGWPDYRKQYKELCE